MAVDQDRLLLVVRRVAHQHGYTCQLTAPEVVTLSGRRTFTYSLTDLRRAAAAWPHDQWEALVADRVDTHLIAVETEAECPLDYTDFSLMRHLVRTRLYGTGSVGATAYGGWSQPDWSSGS
ncbi:hypothetical protein ACIBCD_41755 [Nocardia brasiliensis]|uniref:hypothetical protein n=1 Tax=Nocardia brasiliensis TaxID=37326 RepID=UPI0037B8F702